MTNFLHEHLTPADAEFIAALNGKLTALVKRGSFDPPSHEPPLVASTTTHAATLTQHTQTRDDRDAIAARQSLLGVHILSTPNDGLPSDDHITGRIGGTEKIKREVAWTDPAIGLVRPKGAAITQVTTLYIPCVRPISISNADHVTTLHFSHRSKSRGPDCDINGAAQKNQTAADHASYLERDNAIAQTEIETVEVGIAAAGANYIEQGASKRSPENVQQVLFSNIAPDFAGRQEFWKQVEAHERAPGDDKITLLANHDRELWSKILIDPECPLRFKENYDAMHKRKGAKSKGKSFVTGGAGTNEKISALLRKISADESAWGCTFSNPRGGRIQMRIEGELPAEVSHEARVRIVQEFAQEFEKRNLPYQAVIHEPDHRNDGKNWHFHVAYYDRAAKIFTGKAEDYLSTKTPPETKKAEHAIALAALADQNVQSQIGQWDFTVAYTRKDASRHTKTTFPFAQSKNRECNAADFPKKLRVRLAELINDELTSAGVLRRVSSETYASLGIDKIPDQHLGPKRNEFEKMGVATARGIENERNDWAYRLGRAIAKRNQDKADCQTKLGGVHDEIKSYINDANVPNFTDGQLSRHADACDQYSKLRAQQRRLDFVAFFAGETIARAKSRAEKLREDMKKMLAAIKNGRAGKQDKKNRKEFEQRLAEAERHLSIVEAEFKPEIARLQHIQSQQTEIADAITDLESRLKIAPFTFFAEIEADQKAKDIISHGSTLGAVIEPLLRLTGLMASEDHLKRTQQLEEMERQLEQAKLEANARAEREQQAAERQLHSSSHYHSQSASNVHAPIEARPEANAQAARETATPSVPTPLVQASPPTQPVAQPVPAQSELAAPVPQPTPPVVQQRPVPAERPSVPVETQNNPPPKVEPTVQRAAAEAATASTSSPAEPVANVPSTENLGNRMVNFVKARSEQRNVAADSAPQDTKPIHAATPPSEQSEADARDRVTMPQPAPTPATLTETKPERIAPAKVEEYPDAELGPRFLGNKSAMHSGPSTNPELPRPRPNIAAGPVPAASPVVIDPMAEEWAKAVSTQLSKARKGTAFLKAIHPEIRTWFAARREGNADAQMAAAAAIARDQNVFQLMMEIPKSGIIPEDFGHQQAWGTTPQPKPSSMQSRGIDPARAAQMQRGPRDRGMGIGDD